MNNFPVTKGKKQKLAILKTDNPSASLKITDDTFREEYSTNYHLSVIFNSFSLSYCILDLKQNRLLGLEEINFEQAGSRSLSSNLKDLISGSSFLNRQYKSVGVALYNEKSTLVPHGLFDKSKAREYLQFSFSEAEIFPAADFLQENDLYNVYNAPEIIVLAIKELFNNAKIFHFSSPLLENLAVQNKHQGGLKVYIHFFEKRSETGLRFELIIFEKSRLLFYNSFPWQAKEDIAYFFLYVLGQLNINPENLLVTVLGNIAENDEALELLNKYVLLEFGMRPRNFHYPEVFDEIPSHYFYSLLSQYIYF